MTLILEWIECLGKSIEHIHLHDNDGTIDAHLALGKGKLPVEEMLCGLKRISGNMTYTIECSTYEDVIATYQLLKKYGIE